MAEIDSAETLAQRSSGGQRGPTEPQTAQSRLLELLTHDGRQPGNGGSYGGGSSSDSESGDDEPRKWRKLQPSDMPWHNRKGESAMPENPSCEKSAHLIQRFN